MSPFILGLLLSLSAVRTVSANLASQPCCTALFSQPELKNKVYAPNDLQYGERLKTYYSANAAQAPWCMVLPETTEDVATTAQIISTLQCPFGMRSGAHSAWKGANGVRDGVTIDFAYMDTTTYDADNKIARIQPGSNWGHVYEVLDPYHVSAVGGRASVVGVGGFTTGAGYSFHSNFWGFSCDNVANFEVVIANGSIVNANKDQNADLWKALKGGSGNFGFVTRINQRIVESKRLWAGFLVFDPAERDPVFEAYLDFAKNMDTDPALQLIVTLQYDGNERSLLSVMSNIDGVALAPAFANFTTIKNVSSTLTTGSMAKLVPQFTGPTPLGLYANWMTGLSTNDIRVMTFMDEKHAEYTDKMRVAAPEANFSMLVAFSPITQTMVRHSAAAGGNVLGLESIVEEGPMLMYLITVTVDLAANQDKIHPLTLEYRDSVNTYASSIGAYRRWEYLNYALGD